MLSLVSEKQVKKFHTDDALLSRSIWVVLLIGWSKFFSTSQKHYPDLGRVTWSVQISAHVPQTSFGWETGGGVIKWWLLSTKAIIMHCGNKLPVSHHMNNKRHITNVLTLILLIRNWSKSWLARKKPQGLPWWCKHNSQNTGNYRKKMRNWKKTIIITGITNISINN